MNTRFRPLLIIGLLLLPAFVSAQSVSVQDLIAQTQSLIKQINTLQTQQGYSSTGTTVAGGTVVGGAPAGCPSLTRTLARGSSGSDVSSLQQFLAQDSTIYPEQMVTGHFGALTELAVQRFQARYGVLSSGTPSSNGFGVVGQRTRAAIAAHCTLGGSSGSGAPGVVSGFIQVTPASGVAPLTSKVTATVNTAGSCTAVVYTVDFGDGSQPQTISTGGNCNQQSVPYMHVYQSPGAYSVVLSSGSHKTSTSVTVSGVGAAGQGVSLDTIHPSVSSGNVPFPVTFTGNVYGSDAGACASNCSDTLNFGDGASAAVPLPAGGQGYATYTVTHTYTMPGTYTASLGTASTTFVAAPVTATGFPPSLTLSVGVTSVSQGGVLPVTWQSNNVASSTAVALWIVNVQSGNLYPLALILNPTGSFSAPIPATADQGTVPPLGAYEVVGKIYTPADAILASTQPTFLALAQSTPFNVTGPSGTTAASNGTYAISSVILGAGGDHSLAFLSISYPSCATYTIDWGDGLQTAGGSNGSSGTCTTQTALTSHRYAQNGTVIVHLNNGSGVQQASVPLTVVNAGTVSSYGISTVTAGVGSALNVSTQVSVPACPSYSLDWGDGALPTSQTAAANCTGTAQQSLSFSHTYASSGTYSIKLRDASSTVQSSAAIILASQ